MHCVHCGAANDDNAWRCTSCGRELRAAPAPPPPSAPPGSVQNWLVPAILSTVFCCWPLGIPAIIFAAKVNEQLARGDVAGAEESSRKARLFTLLSVGAILVLGLAYLVVIVAVGIAGAR
jgi:hypothetical protein